MSLAWRWRVFWTGLPHGPANPALYREWASTSQRSGKPYPIDDIDTILIHLHLSLIYTYLAWPFESQSLSSHPSRKCPGKAHAEHNSLSPPRCGTNFSQADQLKVRFGCFTYSTGSVWSLATAFTVFTCSPPPCWWTFSVAVAFHPLTSHLLGACLLHGFQQDGASDLTLDIKF